MAPKASFEAMLGADAVDEGVVSFEGSVVLDTRVERLAFEHMPCGMAVALVFCAVQGVLDHGSPEESGRERLLTFEGFGSRIEKEISVAVALGAALEHEPGGVSQLLPVDEKRESGAEMRERESVIEGLLFGQHICIGLDLIGQLSDLGVRLRASDRSAQQATATGLALLIEQLLPGHRQAVK